MLAAIFLVNNKSTITGLRPQTEPPSSERLNLFPPWRKVTLPHLTKAAADNCLCASMLETYTLCLSQSMKRAARFLCRRSAAWQ